MRYKIAMAYKGNNYVGFQRQKNGLAVQEVIEDRLQIIFNEDIRIVMASRTDSGVHALYQVVHFDSVKLLDPFKLKASLNGLLPKDIHVLEVSQVSNDFHARYSVKTKTYIYKIKTGEYDVFLNGLAYYCPYPLDLEIIAEGIKLFNGRHDFASFNTSPYDLYPDQVREIYNFTMTEKEDGLLVFEIKGSGFLRHMVRMIIGTLVDLGRGKKSLDEVKMMLEKPSKSKHRYNIDPNGLYLKMIEY